MKRNILPVVVWFFAFSGRSIPLFDGAENIDRIYFENRYSSIQLSTQTGNIHIVSDDTLFVETVKTVRNINSDSALVLMDFVEVTIDSSGDRLGCSYGGPAEKFPEDVNCQVSFICHVPPYMSIDAYSATGNIDVHEMFSAVKCEVGTGNINMAGGNGTVDIKIGTGNINLRWSMRSTDALLIDSDVCNTTVLLPLSLCADVSVKLGTGNFSISGFEEVLTNSSEEHGLYIYTLKGGGSKIDITNNTGNITIMGY